MSALLVNTNQCYAILSLSTGQVHPWGAAPVLSVCCVDEGPAGPSRDSARDQARPLARTRGIPGYFVHCVTIKF